MKPGKINFETIRNTTLAAALLFGSLTGAGAQRNNNVNPVTGGSFQSGSMMQQNAAANNGFGAFLNGASFGSLGYFGYGGTNYYFLPDYYRYSDPTFAVTPFGLQPLGYGYNGFVNYMNGANSGYMNGYADALNNMDANAVNPDENAPANNNEGPGWSGYRITRVPHGSDKVGARRLSNGVVALRWQGDPRNIVSITFSLTDSKGRVLRSQTVTSMPAEVRLTRPSGATFYQAFIRYVDGAANTVMAPL